MTTLREQVAQAMWSHGDPAPPSAPYQECLTERQQAELLARWFAKAVRDDRGSGQGGEVAPMIAARFNPLEHRIVAATAVIEYALARQSSAEPWGALERAYQILNGANPDMVPAIPQVEGE